MSSLDSLTAAIEAEATLDAKLQAFVQALAERIKATSNDQNVQRLSRELATAAPALARAIIVETRE